MQRRISQPTLEVQREHQPDPAEADEVHQPERRSSGVAGGSGQQPGVQQGRPITPHHPLLPAKEQRNQHRCQHKQPPEPAQPTVLDQDQRQQQAQHTGTQQQRADNVDLCCQRPAATLPRGHQPPGCHERDQPDRNVDVEDPTPALLLIGRGEDEAAEHRADRCGQPDGGAEDAERPAPLRTPEQHLDQPRVLRGEHSGSETLQQPRRDQQARARRRSAQRAGQDEPGQGGKEHPPATQGISQPPTCHQHQPEGECVARHHPLHLRHRGTQALLDRGQRNIDDADVQQAHETSQLGDREGSPALRVSGLVRGGFRTNAHRLILRVRRRIRGVRGCR